MPQNRKVPGSEYHARPGTTRVDADPDEEFSVTIRLRQRPDSPRLPTPQTQWAKQSRAKCDFLSPAEFGVRYGASQADLDQVVDFVPTSAVISLPTSIAKQAIWMRSMWAFTDLALGRGALNTWH